MPTRPAFLASRGGTDHQTLQLLSALQLQPRASWTMLAPILGTSATTLARRWKTLSDEGLAWITCSPGFVSDDSFFFAPNGATAYLDLVCAPGERDRVLTALEGEPSCWTIACTTGTRDVTVAVTRGSAAELDRFIHQRIGTLEGMVSLRWSPLRKFLQAPSNWRIGALSQAQVKQLRNLPKRTPKAALDDPGRRRDTNAVMHELALDGRASASGIAERLGLSTSSVNDIITELQHSSAAEWRLDIAQAQLGWPVAATIAVNAPPSRMPDIATQLRRFSLEVREAAALVGSSSLQVHVWATHVDTVDAVEEMLEAQFPDVSVTERWLTTRFAKRAGAVLDEHGRKRYITPMLAESPPGRQHAAATRAAAFSNRPLTRSTP